jgi:hypothetical protein
MFIGHIAVGFAGKAVSPDTRLGTSIAAATLVDLVMAVLLIAGIERIRIVPGITAAVPLALDHYPWSHSLASALVLSALASGLYYLATRNRRGSLWIAAAVASHWILDLATHIPDLPLWPGGPLVGLGLWNSIPGTIAVEGTLYALGILLYVRATEPRNRWGHVSLWFTASFLAFLYASSFLVSAPPSMELFQWGSLFQGVLVVLLGYWIDRTRKNRGIA